jgi:Xaa-Pro aminopeptidase
MQHPWRHARLLAMAVALAGGLMPVPVGVESAAQIPPLDGEAAFSADLTSRRTRVRASFAADTVVVLSSAPARVFSTDTDYEYRQESNLLYLTGLAEENITLVLVPGSAGDREFLFIPAVDPTRELWNGRGLRVDEAIRQSGIARVFAQSGSVAFDAFMRVVLGGAAPAGSDATAAAAAAAAAGAGVRVSKVAVVDTDRGQSSSPETDSARRVADARRAIDAAGRTDVTVVDASRALLSQRQIKTPYEQNVLRRSVAISAQAHVEGMKVARPGAWEYEVEAAIEHWFLKNGAMSWGYPSIVGSGPNATVLHYLKSTRQMQDGDLLLVDAAGNYQGLTGDITRTYPVNGRFSPAQRALYEVVLAALDAGVKAARPGGAVEEIELAVRASLGRGLLTLGLVTDAEAASGPSSQVRAWFPHSAVHGIGVDVHDPLGALAPGAAFVIEPGVYIRSDTLERLSSNSATAAFAAAIRPAVGRYANMGIRLEDSFLMTATGPETLSSGAPLRIADLERLVGSAR